MREWDHFQFLLCKYLLGSRKKTAMMAVFLKQKVRSLAADDTSFIGRCAVFAHGNCRRILL